MNPVVVRLLPALWIALVPGAVTASGLLEVGLASRDITPEEPIWLAGYAARKRPSEKVDGRLMAGACAIRDTNGERVVLVAIDNCEVSRRITDPVLDRLQTAHGLKPGAVMLVSSHTHSAPVVGGPLLPMYDLNETERARVDRYEVLLRNRLIEVAEAALTNLQPARLEHGVGRATFAMNRRMYRGDRVDFGENLDGPVDWDVPVLRVTTTNGVTRGILFGYACHGTSITGEDFFTVSGDFMAYAREHLESHFPGATALFFTGMGADSNPSPRGTLADAKRHGLELAGAVTGVLNRSMRAVAGPVRLAFEEVDLALHEAPPREQIEKDARGGDYYVRSRARTYLERIEAGQVPAPSVHLPLAVIRIGEDLTFIAMGGEVVVDYAIRFKRLFSSDHPWFIGYAYEVPCYIPSVRILKEGGYEADSSLIYYGIYGPFKPGIEETLVNRATALVETTRQGLR